MTIFTCMSISIEKKIFLINYIIIDSILSFSLLLLTILPNIKTISFQAAFMRAIKREAFLAIYPSLHYNKLYSNGTFQFRIKKSVSIFLVSYGNGLSYTSKLTITLVNNFYTDFSIYAFKY